jgi:hypothetical protein
MRSESDRSKCSAIFLQRDFAVGASIQIVEYDLRQTAPS